MIIETIIIDSVADAGFPFPDGFKVITFNRDCIEELGARPGTGGASAVMAAIHDYARGRDVEVIERF